MKIMHSAATERLQSSPAPHSCTNHALAFADTHQLSCTCACVSCFGMLQDVGFTGWDNETLNAYFHSHIPRAVSRALNWGGGLGCRVLRACRLVFVAGGGEPNVQQ